MTPSMIEGCKESLRRNWCSFCDCDPLDPPDLDRDRFIEQMEQSGLVKMKTATKRDVEDESFAYEKGIEVGAPIWVLTSAGSAAIRSARNGGGS